MHAQMPSISSEASTTISREDNLAVVEVPSVVVVTVVAVVAVAVVAAAAASAAAAVGVVVAAAASAETATKIGFLVLAMGCLRTGRSKQIKFANEAAIRKEIRFWSGSPLTLKQACFHQGASGERVLPEAFFFRRPAGRTALIFRAAIVAHETRGKARRER